MGERPSPDRFGPEYTPVMVAAITSCTAAIARLDARISVSPVASAWALRAAWSGYARALQLQGVEVDEIDVFSWGCSLRIPGRSLRATNLDQYERFGPWRAALQAKDLLAWRDALPMSIAEPPGAADHPPLVGALDRVRQHARIDGTITPWLGLPFALRDQRLSASALPCLGGGSKALRLKRRPDVTDWLSTVRSLEASALKGFSRLDQLERLYRAAQRAISDEYRPGALPSLVALSCHRPLLSPQSVSETLGMSIAGASKLLERTAATGLLVEITQRRTWRLFLASDLAVDFGYAAPKRGRPKAEPPPLPATGGLVAVFDAFDEEMSAIDDLLRRVSGND